MVPGWSWINNIQPPANQRSAGLWRWVFPQGAGRFQSSVYMCEFPGCQRCVSTCGLIMILGWDPIVPRLWYIIIKINYTLKL